MTTDHDINQPIVMKMPNVILAKRQIESFILN